MIKSLYSIADQKSNIYLPPFLAHNDADAQRQLLTMMQKEQNMLSMYPEDYSLTKIGTFDDGVGLIDPLPIPQIVVNLKALIDTFKESKNDGNPDTPNSSPSLSPSL